MDNSLKLKRAEGVTNTNPTQEQIDSDNYTKGVVELFGFRIVIENPSGSVRKGVDNTGEIWSIKMSNTYGYFSDTIGADGEGVDVFIGSNSQLVAPLTISAGSTIGAGSTITKDTPANQLSLARSKQTSIPSWERPKKK